jgi:hypothetical protein
MGGGRALQEQQIKTMPVRFLCILVLFAFCVPRQVRAELPDATPASVTIDLGDHTGGQPRFDPREALGAGIDGASSGNADRVLTPGNISAMRAAGLQALTYRLRTELGVEAWHWNPVGRWSDPAHSQGYWVSSARLGSPIRQSFGYRLPRRGDTVDNANDNDYSRLTDGDEASYWKSNPYLDPGFLRDRRPHWQWLVVRLDAPQAIDGIRIAWGNPYAVRYRVQYWNADRADARGAHWVNFPQGRIIDAKGGDRLLRLTAAPITSQFVRVLLEQGSHTTTAGATDWRDRAGFAIREIGIGLISPDGRLTDYVRHVANHDRQTFTHVSSTDPWHRASDRDDRLEQPGLDRVFTSGLTNGHPMLLPVGLLFDVPENAAAELRYVRRRGYPVRQVELGEEPDGQYGEAQDYGALYLAWIDRLRPGNRGIAFGGPSAQDALTGTWMNADPDRSWNSHFIRYLKSRRRLGDLGFYSFEFYPFDDICGDIPAKLIEQDHLMHGLMARLAAEGVPRDIPWIISEYGFSAYSGRAMSQMPSALLMANIIGQFLSEGGNVAYRYGYEPNVPINQKQACAGYGNMMLHMADPAGQATTPMPSFETARLITDGWLMAEGGVHRILASKVSGVPGEWVRSYAVRRPDGRIGILLINRDPAASYSIRLRTRDAFGHVTTLQGPADLRQYGPAQYAWADEGTASHPLRSEPPTSGSVGLGEMLTTLPPQSLTVVIR